MSLTREETLEYLGEYSKDLERISLVLLELGEDPDANEYPDNIVERAEKVFETLGNAKTKALASSQESQSTQLTVQQTTAIAAELLEQQGVSFPPDVLMVLAQSAVEEVTQLAECITNLKEDMLFAALDAGDNRITGKVLARLGTTSEIIQEVFTPENVKTFVASAVPQVAAPDTKGFLAGLDERRKQRQQLGVAKQQQRAALPRPKVDVAGFLAARP